MMFGWKNLILSCLASVIITGLFCYWMQQKENSLVNAQIKLLEAQRDSLQAAVGRSQRIIDGINKLASKQLVEIDSLESIISRLRKQTQMKQDEIDVLIERDSANAINAYRKGLADLGTVPDETPSLTFREIGYGAKYFAEAFGLRLTVNYKDSVVIKLRRLINLKNKIIAENNLIKSNLKKLVDDTNLQNEVYKAEIIKKDSFFFKRFNLVIGWGIINQNSTFGTGFFSGIAMRIN